MYLFSLILIKKTLTQVFFDDVFNIVMMSTEIIEGDLIFISYSLWIRAEDYIL